MAYRNLFTPVPPTPASTVAGGAMPAGVRAVDPEAFVSAFVKSVKRKLPDEIYTGGGPDAAAQWQDIKICLRLLCKYKHEAFNEVIDDALPPNGVNPRANEIVFQCLHAICGGEAAKIFRGHDWDMDGRRMFLSLQAKHAQNDRAARKEVENEIRAFRLGMTDPASKLDDLLLLFRRLDAIIGVPRQEQDNVSDMMDTADCETIYGVAKRVAKSTGQLATMDGGAAREFLVNEWREYNSNRRVIDPEGSLLNSSSTVTSPTSENSATQSSILEADDKKTKALAAIGRGDYKFVADLYYAGQYRKGKGDKGKGSKGKGGADSRGFTPPQHANPSHISYPNDGWRVCIMCRHAGRGDWWHEFDACPSLAELRRNGNHAYTMRSAGGVGAPSSLTVAGTGQFLDFTPPITADVYMLDETLRPDFNS